MDSVQAIQCKQCGAPSYADQARKGFFCPYCGDCIPWAITSAHFASAIQIRHRPVPVVDGLLKLTHVGLPEREPENLKLSDELSDRVRNTADKLSELDTAAFKAWNAREMLAVSCKHCGAAMTGNSTQNIFECEYCKNKIMDAEAFASGVYRKEIFGYDNNMYNMAIPFSVSKEEAKRQILQLAAKYPKEYGGLQTEKRIDADLQALYLPYRLEDVSLKATVKTERGTFTFYHDRINWATPRTALFDIHLMNALHPWDFGATSPFAPAYLEGDVQIFSPANNESVDLAMKRMLWRDVPNMITAGFGVQSVELQTWEYNFRRHKYAYFNLPIWFLDKRREDGERDLQLRMAVNGQTGKAAALFLKAGEIEYIRKLTAEPTPEMSCECTMYSPPIPISYVKSPFLFRAVPLHEAMS